MTACVNKIILVGYLGKDPEQRFTQSGRPVTSFTLATSERWKVDDGEREQRTEWFNVVVWNRLAEVCKTYLGNRFRLVQVSYPEPAVEQSILSRTAPVIDSGIREKMIGVANEIRRLFMGESNDAAAIEITMSTRSLVRWAHLALAFKGAPLSYSMDRALTFRAQPETREAVLQIVQRHFGSSSV